MKWIRVDEKRLEGTNDQGSWSITTFRYKDRDSVHIRLNGRIKKYALNESEAMRYVQTNSETLT
jgi:hypothetical protein